MEEKGPWKKLCCCMRCSRSCNSFERLRDKQRLRAHCVRSPALHSVSQQMKPYPVQSFNSSGRMSYMHTREFH